MRNLMNLTPAGMIDRTAHLVRALAASLEQLAAGELATTRRDRSVARELRAVVSALQSAHLDDLLDYMPDDVPPYLSRSRVRGTRGRHRRARRAGKARA